MGILLIPHGSSFHSLDNIHHLTIGNLLLCITFFEVATAFQIFFTYAAAEQFELENNARPLVSSACETKILDEVPPDPYYDASDVTINAARKLSEFIINSTSKGKKSSNYSLSKIDVFRMQANALANEALKNDDNLIAFALAAPSLPLAVVQFREKVDNRNITDHAFLSIYWRELGIAWNQTDGAQFWGAPFKDCGPMKGRWLWPFSVTVVVQNVKTVASSFIAADQDACIDALEEIFGKKHSCDRETTFCLMTESEPAESVSQSPLTNTISRPTYTCVCKEGFYIPNQTLQGFPSDKVESKTGNFSCVPCPGCAMCDKDGSCFYGHEEEEEFLTETVLRTFIGVILGACIGSCFLLSLTVFRQRKRKTIATSMWTILETILLGIIFLYSAVALHFLPATSFRCMLEPWLREVGFIICYGAIVLKLYRHLVEFRTRKAHRYVVRDLDLLRYLCAMIVAVLCYLAAFTALCIDYLDFSELTWNVEMESITTSNMCKPLKWDYVTQSGEMLILSFGIQLAYASRNANTQFRERQFLVASIVIEFIVSSSYYIIKDWYLPELNPTTLLLAMFIRSQLTNTVTVILIFMPKIYYQHRQGAHESSHHHHGLSGYAGICFGDPEAGDLTISEMSPEEVRSELKRLYTQLEHLKNKTLRLDNPHISKRRGGRKVAHRRFSLQALSAKHRNNRPPPSQDVEITEAEPSRTPEDSVCSIEGPTDTGTGGEASGISASK
ncbi:CLUMA_CG014026, isoform B [Clunio marinus]|uniref:CLUMA_CG014026, isoform B n=1 Tax=Clunio marinus TaxID=568069 RepID=A0A1J1IMI7_9DIPT|nr:CLUMA_CG014026, isoform B [Clunio marinus]